MKNVIDWFISWKYHESAEQGTEEDAQRHLPVIKNTSDKI